MAPTVPGYHSNTPLHSSFDEDIRDLHLLYDYDTEAPNGTPEKWRYEIWFFSHHRIACSFQCIRPGTLEYPEEPHGDKHDPVALDRWRKLALLGKQTDRLILSEQASILETFRGKGDLVPIAPDAENFIYISAEPSAVAGESPMVPV
uniref:Uncharacterized protein n=1 Tax=Globisporangium ultimum (strain ATCC 200006 / CBS 805.95 / DAOM BR144) TaxID=431595 RepID=K3WSS1_GLOUD